MKPDFAKGDGLLPAIVQDSRTRQVLMLGYMNEEALRRTREEKRVTFYSRSKKRLWTKGETSGNVLLLDDILLDCDGDALLIRATPTGPVCHNGSDTCWNESNAARDDFLHELQEVIRDRRDNPQEGSYTASLFRKGMGEMARKVGEEATECIVEALSGDRTRFGEEAADLLFHFLVLLRGMEFELDELLGILRRRHTRVSK